jgi:hypothetical protein
MNFDLFDDISLEIIKHWTKMTNMISICVSTCQINQ